MHDRLYAGSQDLGQRSRGAGLRQKIITKVDLDGPVLCSEDHILGGAVFDEKNITVSDAPGMGIQGFVPGKVTYLDD